MLARVLLVVPAAALLLSPFALLAAAVADEPGVLAVLADKPLATLQLAAGLTVSVLFCVLPLSRALDRLAAGVRSRHAYAASLPSTPAREQVPLRLAG